MKKILTLIIFLFSGIILFGQTNPNHVYVKPHYRNGQYIKGHYRTAPNSTNRDNFSTRGNINPYTLEPGKIAPDNKPVPTYSYPSYSPSNSYSNYNLNNSYSPNTNNNYNSYNSNKKFNKYSLKSNERAIYYSNGTEVFGVIDPNEVARFSYKEYTYYDYLEEKIVETNEDVYGYLLHGTYKFYDENDILKESREYEYGILDGISIVYNNKGEEEYQIEYSNGKIEVSRLVLENGNTLELFGNISSPSEVRIYTPNKNLLIKKIYSSSNSWIHYEYNQFTSKLLYEINFIDSKVKGLYKEYHEDGENVKIIGFVEDKIDNGNFKQYYKNGNLFGTYSKNNGILHGEYTRYHIDGNLVEKGVYSYGLLHGNVIEYDDYKTITEYKFGKKHGSVKFFIGDKLLAEGQYLEDKEEGVFNFYRHYDNGEKEIAQFTTYRRGEKHGKFLEEQGDSIISGSYLNGDYHGKINCSTFDVFTSESDPTDKYSIEREIYAGEYTKGIKSGYWKYYSSLGELQVEGAYKNGEKHGTWIQYGTHFLNDKGELTAFKTDTLVIVPFRNGKTHGEVISFGTIEDRIVSSPDNKNVYTGLYFNRNYTSTFFSDDQKHGKHIRKDTLGRKTVEGQYLYNKRDGEWIYRTFEGKNEASDRLFGKDRKKFLFVQIIEYKYDRINGKYEEVYAIGGTALMYTKGQVRNKKRVGKWELELPEKTITVNFKNGELDNCEEYRNEKLISKGRYTNNQLSSYTLFDTLTNRILFKVKVHSINRIDDVTLKTTYTSTSYRSDTTEIIKRIAEEYNSNNDTNDSLGILNMLSNNLNLPDNHGFVIEQKYDNENNGEYKLYISNKLIESGQYKNGKKADDWTTLYRKQNCKVSSVFEDGKLVSETFYKIDNPEKEYSGKLKIPHKDMIEEIRIRKGKRHGKTKFRNLSGKVIKVEKYSKGELVN